jgi:hypothetical protein
VLSNDFVSPVAHFHPAGIAGFAGLSKTWLPSGGMTTAEEKKGM